MYLMLSIERIKANDVGKSNFKLLYEMPFHGNLKIFAKNHHHIIGPYIEKNKRCIELSIPKNYS